jgi:chorismate mutase-like protein
MSELDLKLLRNELDKIDNDMLELLSKRFDIVLNIGSFKKENNLPIFQPDREKELLNNKSKLGDEFGLDEKFVKEFFQIIMDESKNKQEEFLELHK